MTLVKINKIRWPTFDDYICDLAVMFEAYPSRTQKDRECAGHGLALIDQLEKVANQMPDISRSREEKTMKRKKKKRSAIKKKLRHMEKHAEEHQHGGVN